jgi:glutaminyl-peptide cyclotransferase
MFGRRIIQLTWRSHVGLVWDAETMSHIDSFSYVTEGWGITHDDKLLIMSDGSDTLFFRDPKSFDLIRKIQVTDEKGPVKWLNELEFINGQVWANVWKTDKIAIINPQSGKVTAKVDLSKIVTAMTVDNKKNILNGIAYDKVNDRIFVTGKRWTSIFEIKIKGN